ncbi:hypothetical protein CR51_22845 [Caballeronia megalochromosomata]|nr:hypothetical protein CR51_22845 [Caballeronia megalochromosomata]
MKGNNAFASNKRAVALGRLKTLHSLSPRPDMAAGFPDDMPFLTFPLTESEGRCVPKDARRANFGLGHIELEDRVLMTMRLQFEGTQLYWIAEMTDPELWAAIDMWRKYKQVLFGLNIKEGSEWHTLYVGIDFRNERLKDEIFRAGPQRVASAHDWHEMASLVTGLIQRRATTDIPGVPLKHAFASALLTEQYEDVAREEPLVKSW